MKIIILTCEARAELFTKLFEKLKKTIESDDEIIVCKDNYEKPLPKLKSTAYQNFQNGWRVANNEPALFLEDDAYLCDNFIVRVKAEINKRPNEIIQFFSRRKADETEGSRYLPMGKFSSCVCYYLPKGYGNQILDYSYKYYLELPNIVYHHAPTDLMLSIWGGRNKLRYWNVVPNLVQHLGHVSIISPKRLGGRVSKTFKEFE